MNPTMPQVNSPAIPLEDRLELLRGAALFASLPEDALAAIAASSRVEEHKHGTVLIREADLAHHTYVLTSGWASVTTETCDGPVLLATLQAGETFGELGVLDPTGRRQASVTALTDVSLLVVDAERMRALLSRCPAVQAGLDETCELLLLTRFLKSAEPFRHVDAAQLRAVAAMLQREVVPAGADVVRRGEYGDRSYLVRSGRLEVLAEEGGRPIAVLEPGAIVGEAALLLDAPRNATVRALEQSELLMIPRSVLLELLGESDELGRDLLEMVRERSHADASAEDEAVRKDVSAAILSTSRRTGAWTGRRSSRALTVEQLLDLTRKRSDRDAATLGTYEQVYADMGRLVEHWESRLDRRCIFLRCYWIMTDAMLRALAADRFVDACWTRGLLQSFSEYYFDALIAYERGSASAPMVWQRTFQMAALPQTSVLENLLLGINAHISRDLVFAVAHLLEGTWATLDEEARARRKADFDLVNRIIYETARAVQEDVIARYDRPLGTVSRLNQPVTDFALMGATRLLTGWRDEVWETSVQLLEAADRPARDLIARMVEERSVRRVSQVVRGIEFRRWLAGTSLRGAGK